MPSSSAFDDLHPLVQKWIWNQKWNGLREIQENTIFAIRENENDIVVSAPTAGGKTEAAFLPIYSQLLNAKMRPAGFEVLCVSPLKALINDQAERLESLADITGILVHPWHGDISQSRKRKARNNPSGVLLITPESLEAMFVLRGNEVASMFKNLKFMVVDELHAFIASERGIQLQSLMHRIEERIGNRVRRIGLSATLGDVELAKAALRPSGILQVSEIVVKGDGAEIKLQIRGYETALVAPKKPANGSQTENSKIKNERNGEDNLGIAAHLFKVLRGQSNLVFAGSRQNVEIFADQLRKKSEDANVPNEFLPHHGNLSKELRHDVERKLKDGKMPYSAVCTTTLELGIDIGDVESIAHIGAPTSISGLKQKLGRSGRRPGKPAILRIYTKELALDAKSSMLDRLRLNTVQSVASVQLLLQGWCEPPRKRSLHLSTFLHQILSVIVSRGGILASDLFDLLVTTGPFINIDRTMFVKLLRHLANEEVNLVEQSSDGTIMLGETGEQIVEHYSFYAVFQTTEEYRVEVNGKTLGTLPVDTALARNSTIVFAGRRWKLLEIRDQEKLLIVKPSSSGVPVKFGGTGGALHDRLVKEVQAVLDGKQEYKYLNKQAQKHLAEGRDGFQQLLLSSKNYVVEGKDIFLFPWVGTDKLVTLQLALLSSGIDTSLEGAMCVKCEAEEKTLVQVLQRIENGSADDAIRLAEAAGNKHRNKFDNFLEPSLLTSDFASEQILADSLQGVAKFLLN